jgi:hypothetical protein
VSIALMEDVRTKDLSLECGAGDIKVSLLQGVTTTGFTTTG